MLLSEAKNIAESIISCVSSSCKRIEIAGSIRREKEDVKDIELVVIVDDYGDFFKKLSSFGIFIKPGTHEIVEWPPKAGAKYIRMFIHEKIKLDIFVATEENWGCLFLMRTGGATGVNGSPFTGFVPALFQRWKKISGGGKMIGCLPHDSSFETYYPCREEDDFFKLLKMKFVPPNLRNDRSSIKDYLDESN